MLPLLLKPTSFEDESMSLPLSKEQEADFGIINANPRSRGTWLAEVYVYHKKCYPKLKTLADKLHIGLFELCI